MAKQIFLFKILILLSSYLYAQDAELKTSIDVPNPWRLGISSLYYNFSGHQPANGNIYSFDRVSYSTQLLTAGYQYSPSLAFSISAGYVHNYAETNFLGVLYKDSTEGFSDTTIKGTKTFVTKVGLFVMEFGMLLPTGSISNKNKNAPASNYPYNMQLGSGTYDLMANLTYLQILGKHQLGAFTMATVRTGRNAFDYRKGNEYIGKIWYAYQATPFVSPGIWFNYHHLDGIIGADKTYPRSIFTEFYHNNRNFRDLTANITAQCPINKYLTLRGLAGVPIWQQSQNIDDIQVYTRWFAQTGLEAAF